MLALLEPIIKLLNGFRHNFSICVEVDTGDGNITVPHQTLYCINVYAFLNQLRGVCVAKCMELLVWDSCSFKKSAKSPTEIGGIYEVSRRSCE